MQLSASSPDFPPLLPFPAGPGSDGATATDFASAHHLGGPPFPPVRAGEEGFDWFLAELAPSIALPGAGDSLRPVSDAATSFAFFTVFATREEAGTPGTPDPVGTQEAGLISPIPIPTAAASTADPAGTTVAVRTAVGAPAGLAASSSVPPASPATGALPSPPTWRVRPASVAVASMSTGNGYAHASDAGPAPPVVEARRGRTRPTEVPDTTAVAAGSEPFPTLAPVGVVEALPPPIVAAAPAEPSAAPEGRPTRLSESASGAGGASPFENASAAGERAAPPPVAQAENAPGRPVSPAPNAVTIFPARLPGSEPADAPLVSERSVPQAPTPAFAALAGADASRPLVADGRRLRETTDIPVRSSPPGLGEKIAGDVAVGATEEKSASGEKDKNFLNSGAKEFKTWEAAVGITVATVAAPMSESLISFSLAPATVDQPSVDRAAAMPLAQTMVDSRGAVAAALAAATPFSIADGRSVSLQFSVDGAELDVRVELHAGEVRTTFLTDSPELRSALAREWQTLTLEPSERMLRLSAPVIAANSDSASGSGGFGGGHSPPQHDTEARQQAREFFASAAARNSSPQGADEHAPMPARGFVPPPTSRHLHTTA